MCLKSIGFWKSMEGGIILCVIKSQAAQTRFQSSLEGTPKSDGIFLEDRATPSVEPGNERGGKTNGGRSSNHSEYWVFESDHLCTGRRLAAANKEYASLSEN